MKSILILLGTCLLAAMPGAAQGPQLLVRDTMGNQHPLRIDEFNVEVRFSADVAETSITIGFFNDRNWRLEGEFVMSLPEGATVSEYALEVNGAMRDAVAVEKERARRAYEEIKARRVDPGLVEREAGNVYRTRIFPIMPQSLKRMRIGYVEYLEGDGESLRYRLPLSTPGEVAAISCVLRHNPGTSLELTNTAGLSFTPDPPVSHWSKQQQVQLREALEVKVRRPRVPEILVEEDAAGQARFYLTDRFPDFPAEDLRPRPASLRLVWDASRSGARRNHEREFALLDAYFNTLGEVRVRLEFLRHLAIPAGEFAVTKGEWDDLRTALEEVYYDGATRFDALALDAVDEDAVFLVTDGESAFLPPANRVGKPLVVIDAAASHIRGGLRAMAGSSGGTYLDLSRLGTPDALQELTHYSHRIVSVTGPGVAECWFDERAKPHEPVRICGTLRNKQAGEITVHYGIGRRVVDSRKFSHGEVLEEKQGAVVRRLWAQRVLADLESGHPHSERDIVAHCKANDLVSDYTSLIVLERFEDHLRYEIPPPEPELREQYVAALRKRGRRNGWQNLVNEWGARGEWHQADFPWLDVALHPRLSQVAIWTRAMSKAFDREELDQQAFGTIDQWRREVIAVSNRRANLQEPDEILAWKQSVADLVRRGGELREIEIANPAGDRPMVVSVRGFVQDPGKVQGQPGMTLQQAIEKAGGFSTMANPAAVELYRNAGKRVYNLYSPRFEDVALKPGDMIVASDYNPAFHDFRMERLMSGNGGPPVMDFDPRNGPAVFDETDVWADPLDGRFGGDASGGAVDDDPFFAGAEPFAGSRLPRFLSDISADPFSDGGGRAEPRQAETRTIRIADQGTGTRPELADFRKEVAASEDPTAAYRKLCAGAPLSSEGTIEVARILFDHGFDALGEQALSNLIELPDLDIDRVRMAAMWLAEFERWDAAIGLIRALRRVAPEEWLSLYEVAHAARRCGKPQAAATALWELTKEGEEENYRAVAVALAELNSLLAGDLAKAPADNPPAGTKPLRTSFDADLRIVVTTSHPGAPFTVGIEEPTGHVCRHQSPCGGRLTRTAGLAEYMMRRALPGRYTVTCRARAPMTVRVEFFRDWGRPTQTSTEVIHMLKGEGGSIRLGDIEFALSEE